MSPRRIHGDFRLSPRVVDGGVGRSFIWLYVRRIDGAASPRYAAAYPDAFGARRMSPPITISRRRLLLVARPTFTTKREIDQAAVEGSGATYSSIVGEIGALSKAFRRAYGRHRGRAMLSLFVVVEAAMWPPVRANVEDYRRPNGHTSYISL